MILLLLAATAVQAGPADLRPERCAARGGDDARACEGLAFAAEKNWTAAAAAFEAAARAAPVGRDARGATYWAQAGNAWLAAGDAARALAALDSALASGTLTGLARGEAQLDHARALVADGALDAARIDIDLALTTAADDPLAWLLSATLARRTGDLERAKTDIGEALKRAADDAVVQREAGNIAALDGDEAAARAAWGQAARLAPTSDAGQSAVAALKQFDATR